MKRKSFLKGLALGTISLPVALKTCGGEQFAQTNRKSNLISKETFEWKMVTTWPPNFPVVGEGCTLFSRLVHEMSGGRMKIKVFGGGELVPALEVFDTVRSGAAEIGNGCAYYWAGKIPAAQFFASVPFGMNAQQANAWIINGGGLELWEEAYDKFGLLPLPGGNTGVQMGGWFNKAIEEERDFQGLKMRMPGIGGKVIERLGASPVLIAGGELYTSLERGIIDATEWIGPYHDFLMGFHEITKYYYSPGWHEPGTVLEMLFNKERFEELPIDLQQILVTATLQINHWMLSELEAKNAIYLNKIITETNVEVRQFPKDVLNRLREETNLVLNDLVKEDIFAKRVYQSYQDFRNKAAVWSELTEKVFYNNIQAKPDL